MKELLISADAAPPLVGTVIHDVRVPSRLDLKPELIDTLVELLVGAGQINEDERQWLVLVLDEAVVNAMLHGNEGDPRLDIHVRLATQPDGWSLQIDDQGHGFSADAIPNIDDPESLLLEHGRGIRLMREWLDSLTYHRGGASILMRRRRCTPGGDSHAV